MAATEIIVRAFRRVAACLARNRLWIQPLGVIIAAGSLCFGAWVDHARYSANVTAAVWKQGAIATLTTVYVDPARAPPPPPPQPFSHAQVPYVLVRNLSYRPTAILGVRLTDASGKPLDGGWRVTGDTTLPVHLPPWSVVEIRVEVDTQVVRDAYRIALLEMDNRYVPVQPLGR
jgi:hypothetical protein